MKSPRTARRPKRSRLQRLLRGGVFLVLVAVVAACTIPWWVPTGIIADHLARELTQAAGVDVRIVGLTLSWSDGLAIDGLTIAGDDADTTILRVERIRCDMNPLTLLAEGRPDWIELYRPELAVELAPDGTHNLAPLERLLAGLSGRPAPPRLSIQQGRVAVRLPARRRGLDVRVADVQILTADDRTARVTMSASLVQDGAAASISMVLQTDAERHPTRIELTFAGLDIAGAGGEALARLYPHRLRGRCAGKLIATMPERGVVETADLAIDVTDLADDAGVIADRLDADLAFTSAGADGGNVSVTLVGPGATATAKIAFAAGRADLGKLARMKDPLAAASWPHVRSATTGALAVRITGPQLLKRCWPELAREWRQTAGRGMGAELDVTLKPLGKTHFKTVVHLGQAGDVDLAGAITDATALASEWQAMRHKPMRQRVRTAMRHLLLTGTVRVADIQAAAGLAPALAEALTDLPTRGAAAAVGIDHVGLSAAGAAGSGHTYLSAEISVPKHGKAWAEALLTDQQAFWPLAFRMLDAPTKANALALLPPVVVEGGLRVRDLALVKRIAPDLAEAIGGLKLNGRTIGGWFAVEQDGALALQANLEIPAGVDLAVAGVFTKPTDAKARIALNATIVNETALSNISARLTVGKAAATVSGGRLTMTQPAGGAARIAADGKLAVSNVQAWASCLDQVAERMPAGLLKGDAHASVSIDLAGGRLLGADVTANLQDLAVDAGRTFVKPAGQPAVVTLGLAPAGRADQGYRLTLTADCPYATADADAYLPALTPAAVARSGRASVKGTIRDAGALVRHCGDLARALGKGTLSGSATFSGSGAWQADRAEGGLHVAGTKTAFVSAGNVRRAKRPGVPAGIDVTAKLARTGDKTALKQFDVTAHLAGSRVVLHAEGAANSWPVPDSAEAWYHLLRQWDVALTAGVALDQPLIDMAPELAEPIKRYALTGGVVISVESMAEYGDLAVVVGVDARTLAARVDLAGLAAGLGLKGRHAELLGSIGRIVKPGGMPAGANLAVRVGPDLARVWIDEFEAGLGTLSAAGSGHVGLVGTAPGAIALRGRVGLADAGGLAAIVGALKPYRPSGSVQGDVAYTRIGPDDRGVLDADVTITKLAGRYRRKDVQLNGRVEVIGAALGADGRISARRLRTDALDIRAAGSRAAVVADLADIPAAPTGSVTLLGETIDAVAIERWLSPTGEVSPWPEGELTAAAARALRGRAGKTVDMLARLAGKMDVELHARIARLRVRDAVVEQTYDARQLRLDASIRHGRVRGRYATALNGGTISGRFAVSLADAAPVMSARKQLRGVIATKNMAPQIHHFFPGNTPRGTFERAEALRWDLVDLIASQGDPRFVLNPTGSVETVTTDGVLEGTAATGAMAALFPALKATRYHYRKMTAFSTFGADGTAVSDMVFDGKDYGLYMTGTTDADGNADYEAGLLTLGSLQSHRWQHKYRQGRVPLLRFRAHLHRREFTNVTVDYYWPHQSLGTVLLENNILYRMWKD